MKGTNPSGSKQFASRIGLIAATVGSAVGLGNVWRFPGETQANGGAAFVLLYIICVFLLGVPVMVAEFAVGRSGRSDAVGCFGKLKARPGWKGIGYLALTASYLIVCFYMVVAGWTLEYLWESITGALYAPGPEGTGCAELYTARMTEYIGTTWRPLIFTYICIVLNIIILTAGVQKGIERMSNALMPMLFIILLVFCGVSLTLPGASEGLEFFLKPDFSAITPRVALNALGQAFFSLSLGMGILITYSSYFPDTTKLTRTAVTVSLLDMLVALLMGVIIFPAVITYGLTGESLEGATLVFVTLPEVFARMPGTQIWSILFFLLLSVAAITSTISIAEVSVAFVCDRLKVRRRTACLIVLLPLLLFSTVCSLSQGPLNHIRVLGLNIFDLLDSGATNILLPVGSLLLCIYVGWFGPRKLLRDEMTNLGTMRSRMHTPVKLLIRYVAPLLIALVLISNFI